MKTTVSFLLFAALHCSVLAVPVSNSNTGDIGDAVLNSLDIEKAFVEWCTRHGKLHLIGTPSSKVFGENLVKIMQHNHEYRLGKHSYFMALNEYADLTWEEFSASKLGFNGKLHRKLKRSGNSTARAFQALDADVPAEVDWRDKQAVTDVQNQGSCGSCWAFSAVGALESAHAIASGSLVPLSVQQLIDCSYDYGNKGCEGGLMDNAFAYLEGKSHGDDTQSSYPYAGKQGSCRFNPTAIGSSIAGHVDLQEGMEDDLVTAVGTAGPVSIAIHAGAALQFYAGGIFDGVLGSCSGELNHGVLAVGYGTQPARLPLRRLRDYWIVKNSWGKAWGEKGYFRIRRGKNLCGLANAASYPLVAPAPA
mmetsp:Transcript_42550/g.113911  ORF Transcript_42550/g.113911 Transcript_42550/m.113911 type:complete len:363 (+) Transcript_42550:133-1221(+)